MTCKSHEAFMCMECILPRAKTREDALFQWIQSETRVRFLTDALAEAAARLSVHHDSVLDMDVAERAIKLIERFGNLEVPS